MESSVAEDDDYIEVEFINDQAVVCVIKDEAPRNKPSNKLTETQKRNKRTPQISSASIKRKNTRQSSCDNSDDEEHVENDLAIILKPKVLFEDGDVPGDRMFSFHSTQKKTATNKLSSQKTPTSKNKIVKSHQEKSKDQEMFNVDSQGSDDSSEYESKTQNRKSIRTRRSTKNELLDNDSKSLTDTKFGYETPKKSKSSTNSSKVKMTASSTNINLTPKTPRSKKYLNTEHTLTKTPKAVRKQIAKGIARQTCELLDELNDSDYSISDESDESDSDSSSHSNVKVVEPQVNNTNNVSLRRSTRKKEVPFVYRSEEYFLSKSAKSLKKSKTSDNTLKLLKNPALDKEQVNKLSEISNTVHDKKFKSMYKEIVSNFPYWLCLLREGFNLLLYGLGSKRQVINDFRTAMLQDESVLVINGFFPGLTLKEILESLTIDLLALDNCSGTAELVIQQIEETQKLKNAEHIYILVHNLDGVELQNYKTQHVLSRISSLPNVHLIASIDRVNAALMWDNTKLGDYNFLWMDCTNYSPYSVETDFVQSLMVKNIGTQHSLSGLNNVFKSLTANAKRILLLLIKNRIDNKNDKKYGVPFSILYRWCRQRFLVSTDLALRSQLTEFVDHELVKWKRDADVLHVCVDIDVLAQFYKLNEEDDE